MMNLKILGCHSATPNENKHTSSQLLDVKGNVFLIDCGEGTQIQLRKSKVKFSRIQHIFISHLHGDHFYGLIGLISTFRLLGRTSPLTIYGPKGIKEVTMLKGPALIFCFKLSVEVFGPILFSSINFVR